MTKNIFNERVEIKPIDLSDILTICFLSFIDLKNIPKNKLKMCPVTTNTVTLVIQSAEFPVPRHIFSLFLEIFFRSINDKKQIVKMSDKKNISKNKLKM